MTLGSVVAAGLLIALAAVALLAALRLVRTMRRRRGLAHFQHTSADLARRLAAITGPVIRDLDDLRRRGGEVDPIAARLTVAITGLRTLADEGRTAHRAPAGFEPLANALAGELTRAQRSAELAKSGLDALGDPRRMRDAEASTAFKRAALNLRNASDEAGRLASRIGALRPADLDRPTAAVGAIATASLPTYGTAEDDLPIGS